MSRKARSELPLIAAHPLKRRRDPFDDPNWLFELKADGYRGLLYVVENTGRHVSRNRREMRRFRPLADALAKKLRVRSAILDGEIVTRDATGRDQFYDLMRREGEPRCGRAIAGCMARRRQCGEESPATLPS